MLQKEVSFVRQDFTEWFDSNKLTINTDKCKAISFGRGGPEEIVIKNQTLDYKSTSNYFGLYTDPQL